MDIECDSVEHEFWKFYMIYLYLGLGMIESGLFDKNIDVGAHLKLDKILKHL